MSEVVKSQILHSKHKVFACSQNQRFVTVKIVDFYMFEKKNKFFSTGKIETLENLRFSMPQKFYEFLRDFSMLCKYLTRISK